ncbi:hypothetical protein BMS_1848 [Halobacteriovorax marinus SJ]|uniref:Uncharacterized protein n=1 Tax=Halobacteriovorax marinus (strain ATCC BAA-682 / DSM 15412 / SJ) TaxID=862908 RepID=E1X208_HALMS|nr:hypothetical protein [Halobacteriovorax marinus]CBW26668.1 hypothetical protein BMS_1848 [Halobacteriovorax marinus SJ]
MSLATLLPVHDSFHVKAIYEGMPGELVAEEKRMSFYNGDQLIHRTPYESLKDIRFREIGDKSILDLCLADGHIAFNLLESEDESELFYLHTKERIIDRRRVNEFLKKRVRVFDNRALLMFDKECLTWIMDRPPIIFEDEFIEGALIGRVGQDFSHHDYGVLYITNQRLFFNGRKGYYTQLKLEDIHHCLIIDIDTNFRDALKRKSYSLQFNEGDFIVGVQSEYSGKIDAFIASLDPNIIRIERF